MANSIRELQETSPSHPPISAQDTATDQVEEAITHLKICPVEKSTWIVRTSPNRETRIKPLENKAPKAGGKADVEAAILAPAQSSDSPKLEDPEYIAVKKLRLDTDTADDRALAPFAHEVKLLNDFSHPGVVKLAGFVEDLEEGIAWIVLSWEKNGNLREFVRSANWEPPERVSLIDDVARGLNVSVNSQSRAITTDFGSARTMDSAAVKSAGAATVIQFRHRITTTAPTVESLKAEVAASGDFITLTGPAWTIRWAAPELLEGELPGLASDIWALGWICWEAITGNFPFDEENDLAIILRITRGDLPVVGDNAQLKQVKELCSLMGQCWRLSANERPMAIRCQQVISFMNQAIPSGSKVRSASDATRSSGLLCALGWIQLGNDMVSEAEKYFRESLLVAKLIGDKQGRARALHALGGMYYMRCDYPKAVESYIQARDNYSQIGNRLGFAEAVKGLGDVYHLQDKYSNAEELYIQARDTYSQIGNQLGFANSVRGLGDVYLMRCEYSKAGESYIQARDTYSQIGNRQGFANSLCGLGDVYRMRIEYSKAEESYVQARDTYSQVGDQLGFAHSVQGLGSPYSASGQYAQAEKSYLEAESVYRGIGDVKALANNIWWLGWLRRRQAQYGEAEGLVCEASTLYGKLGLKADVARCDLFLTEVRQLTAA